MDQKTIDTYNKMAQDYDNETIDFWERFPKTFITKFTEVTKKNGKILDVGSGPGRDGLMLKKEGFSIICLDASETMVKICKEKGLEAVIGDFLKLPFVDSEFDGVWAYTSLLHVEKAKIKLALHEIWKVLKIGAIFAVGMIEGSTEEYRTSSGVNKPRYFAYYKKDELEKLLKEAGFEILYFEQFKPGSKNYLNFISRK
jgi:ubiquinone/menaquinone biosynthesis C-methylase UbiE